MSTSSESEAGGDSLPRLRRLAWLMDSSIRLPGGYRIGVDGLVGLIPGIGDLLSAGVSTYLLLEAARLKLPVSVLLRMGLNMAVDLLLGAIPLFGDLFDFAFKANQRNVDLIASYAYEPRRTRRQSLAVSAAVLAGLGLALAALVFLVAKLAALLWSALGI
ncbi:MAG TPA: DUF4112 domain-containing protein [Pseudomonadales bacterium]|nr:DUF4112 domain-containing protein [Pseudomonadales bacterium]